LLQVRLRSEDELHDEAALTPAKADYLEDKPIKNVHRGWLHIEHICCDETLNLVMLLVLRLQTCSDSQCSRHKNISEVVNRDTHLRLSLLSPLKRDLVERDSAQGTDKCIYSLDFSGV
jgi:hypothetical protein